MKKLLPFKINQTNKTNQTNQTDSIKGENNMKKTGINGIRSAFGDAVLHYDELFSPAEKSQTR